MLIWPLLLPRRSQLLPPGDLVYLIHSVHKGHVKWVVCIMRRSHLRPHWTSLVYFYPYTDHEGNSRYAETTHRVPVSVGGFVDCRPLNPTLPDTHAVSVFCSGNSRTPTQTAYFRPGTALASYRVSIILCHTGACRQTPNWLPFLKCENFHGKISPF